MYTSEHDKISYQVAGNGQIQQVHPIQKFGFVLEEFNDGVSIVKHGEFEMLEDYVRELETLAGRTAYLGFVNETNLVAYAFHDEMSPEIQATVVNYMMDHTQSSITNRLYRALTTQASDEDISDIFTEMVTVQNRHEFARKEPYGF